MTDCIIIGGGPAGLTAAYHAIKHGLTPIVFEQENFLGGISRTVNYKDYLFDIGGHRFFSKVQVINDIWDEILGDDMLRRGRLSRIYYNGKFFHYPLKPFNALFGLGLFPSVRVLTSYMYSQLFPDKKEDNFETWVSNRFGKYLFSIFFKSYTEKVWGIPCHEISSEWAAQRIKQLSLTKAVLNAFFEKPTSSSQVITTLIHEFKYPKCGPGMMWEKMAEKIKNSGGEVHLNSRVKEIHVQQNCIQHITVMQDGKEITHQAQHFISSMPIRNLFEQMSPSPTKEIMNAATGLNYRDFILIAVIVNQKDIFPDNWIYIHDPQVKLGRIQNFKNWSPHMVPDQEQTCLGLEYFCFEGDGLWNKQDEELIAQAKRELETIQLVKASSIVDATVVRVQKAYPVYDNHYSQNMPTIHGFISQIQNLTLVGRNGMHKYNNQDHSMLTAILAIENIMGGNYNLWDVNTEQEYSEELLSSDLKQVLQTQPQIPHKKSVYQDK